VCIAFNGNWEPISELRSVTVRMGSHDVTYHPTRVNAPALTPAIDRLVLDLPTPKGWKAELTLVVGYSFIIKPMAAHIKYT